MESKYAKWMTPEMIESKLKELVREVKDILAIKEVHDILLKHFETKLIDDLTAEKAAYEEAKTKVSFNHPSDCGACRGTGRLARETCQFCKGCGCNWGGRFDTRKY